MDSDEVPVFNLSCSMFDLENCRNSMFLQQYSYFRVRVTRFYNNATRFSEVGYVFSFNFTNDKHIVLFDVSKFKFVMNDMCKTSTDPCCYAFSSRNRESSFW